MKGMSEDVSKVQLSCLGEQSITTGYNRLITLLSVNGVMMCTASIHKTADHQSVKHAKITSLLVTMSAVKTK